MNHRLDRSILHSSGVLLVFLLYSILGIGSASAGIVFSEIMYNPLGGSSNEFLEVYNSGSNAVNLAGATFTDGISFTFGEVSLMPGGFLVVVPDSAVFSTRYPGVTNVASGTYLGELSNAGERIKLKAADGSELFEVTYGDSGEWPEWADGEGASLVLISHAADPNSPTNWCSSDQLHGTPGMSGICVQCDVVINEALAHTDPPEEDTIELHNVTTNHIAIEGWYLSDDPDVRDKYRITNATLSAGGYAVIYEYQFGTNILETNTIPFSLDGKAGDRIYLTAGDTGSNLTRFVDAVDFGASDNGVSFGRYPNGSGDLVAMSQHTFGSTNAVTLAEFRAGEGEPNAYPKVGPVVISEIMYHPPDTGEPPENNKEDEYIELFNVTDSPVELFNSLYPTNTWKLTSAVSFEFPTNVTIPATSSVLVVGTTNIAAFRSTYSLGAEVPIYGPWSIALDNSDGSVRLRKPDDPEPLYVPYVLVDRVDYSDTDGWPPGPDGHGHSLERSILLDFGNDSANWHVGVLGGSPGASNSSAANLPPLAYIEADAYVFEQKPLVLDGSNSLDPEGGLLAGYAWSQTAGPAGFFSSTQTASTVFTAPSVTTDTVCRIELIVTDDRSFMTTAQVDLVVANVGILVGGVLATNTAWSSADSPVGVYETLQIPAGVELTIAPDTVLLVQPSATIQVEGELDAAGLDGQEVVFECLDPDQFWGGMSFFDGASGSFDRCVFRMGGEATNRLGESISALCAYDSVLRMANCLAEDMQNVFFYAQDSDVTFQSNVVQRTGESINVVNCSALITDNIISFVRNGGDAIDLDYAPTPTPDNPHPLMLVARNVIWASTGDGIDLGTASPVVDGNLIFHCADKGISLGEGSSPLMMNNLIWGCQIGLAIKDGSNPTVQNHTIVNNAIGIAAYEKNPGMGGGSGEVLNSIIWNNEESVSLDSLSVSHIRNSIVGGTPLWPGQNNTNSDPSFVSEDLLDFRLLPASPAIDYASTNRAPDHDMVGTSRPQAAGVDLGALEWAGPGLDFDRDGISNELDAFASDYRYAVDADSDLLPDEWEMTCFGSTNETASGDYDGDGQDNRAEYIQGSDPACAGNQDIIINEFHYNPLSGNASDEFIELYNRGLDTIDLSGWSFTDEVVFPFPDGTILGPGAYLVIACDRGEMENKSRSEVIGDYEGPLGSGLAVIRLTDENHYPVDVVTYNVTAPWPYMADGFGPSMERCSVDISGSVVSNWQVSSIYGGTPGRANSVVTGDVVFNEVLANPSVPGSGWVELVNRGSNSVDLSGQYLGEDLDNLDAYTFPGSTTLGPSQCLSVAEASLGFALSASGGVLFLTESDGVTILNQVEYAAQQLDIGAGRYPDGQGDWYFYEGASAGVTNSPPALNESIVINEIMYHPEEDNDFYEYIELYNKGTVAVDLAGWTFSDGFDYTFPAGSLLNAGAFLVLGHDPATVQTQYGITNVYGPFISGKLSNRGEHLQLLDARLNPADAVLYGDRSPWPRDADGDGPSLELIHADFDNFLVGSWRASDADIASSGTPGLTNSVASTNQPPVCAAASHQPLLPQPGETIEFLVRGTDAEGASFAVLSYQEDGDSGWNSIPMTPFAGSNSLFYASITAPASDTLLLYYFTMVHGASNEVVLPPGAPWVTANDTTNAVTKTYLCMVDSTVYATNIPVFRFLTSSTNWTEFETRDPYSNELLDGTLIVGNDQFRNMGYRLRGTLRYRGEIRFELGEQTLHGDDELNLGLYNHDSEYLGSEFFKKVGIPSYEVRPVRLVRNSTNLGLRAEFESPDQDFINRYYPSHEGSNALCKGTDELYFGISPYTAEMTFKYTEAGPEYEASMEAVLDVDQWMDWFAVTTVINNWDTLLRSPSIWNLLLYYNPAVERWQLLPWDLDTAFPPHAAYSPIHADGQAVYVDRFITWPTYRRGIYERVATLLDDEFHQDSLYPWLTAVYDWIGWEYDDTVFTMVSNRAVYMDGYLEARIETNFMPQAESLQVWTTSSAATFTGSVNTVDIPEMVCSGAVSSVTYPFQSAGCWQVSVTGLTNGPNFIRVACIPLTNRTYRSEALFTVHSLTGDFDGDSIKDQEEGSLDSDQDGIWDYMDTDSDNDTYSDAEEAGDSDPETGPLDSDGDGIADYMDTDSDGDGFLDISEKLAHTDRLDSSSYLSVSGTFTASNAAWVIWRSDTSVIYDVESGDLINWTVVATNLPGDISGTNLWEDPTSNQLFRVYRIRVK